MFLKVQLLGSAEGEELVPGRHAGESSCGRERSEVPGKPRPLGQVIRLFLVAPEGTAYQTCTCRETPPLRASRGE